MALLALILRKNDGVGSRSDTLSERLPTSLFSRHCGVPRLTGRRSKGKMM